MSVLSAPRASAGDSPSRVVELRSPARGHQAKDHLSAFARTQVHNRFAGLTHGALRVVDGFGECELGESAGPMGCQDVVVSDARFYRQLLFGGSLGAAEAYIRGYWDTPDLVSLLRLFARQTALVRPRRVGAMGTAWRSLKHWARSNTRAGSRRNIAAHYDLSNDFFALMLDPSMMYSSGVFASPSSSLQAASTEKIDRICRKLRLGPQDHVLEIGTGWGGFAEHAASHYGCRVTTTTISSSQYEYAQARFQAKGLDRRIRLLKTDYRDLEGGYDKLVSVEMIEAVGERYLPTFFAKCSDLLKPHGSMCLQAILMPDHRYDNYRRSVDFIQSYVFPGGFLPSFGAIAQNLGQSTDLRMAHAEDFASHYARTLSHWRDRFWENIDQVRALGFDERFIRAWDFYLCYCEAGFRENMIGVSQLLLAKPACDLDVVGKFA